MNDRDCPPSVPCVPGPAGKIVAASPDTDNDGVPDHLDNCPDVANPDQKDTDCLPDYHLLDDLLDGYIERDAGSDELVAAGFDREVVEQVLRLVDRAEYKRRQYPPGTKISSRNFGRDRRLPITSKWRE